MSSSAHHVTDPEDRIPLGQKAAYAVGMFVNNLQAAALPAMGVILNLGLGMDPRLVGWLGAIPRIFDAVTDPMVGYISDNTRTKWGRRRPFIIIGALLSGLIFALMWQLYPGYSQWFYFWVFLAASLIFFLSYTLYATPFVALGYEMTADYHERTSLHKYAQLAGQLVWMSVPWFYWLMENKTLFNDKVEGARTLAIAVGITIAVLGIIPALFCRERPLSAQASVESLWSNLSSFFNGLALTLRCSPFVKLSLVTFLVFNGYQLAVTFSIYVMIYYLFFGDGSAAGELQGMFGTLTSLSSLVVIPITAWLASKVGKRTAFMITISISLVGYAMKWFGYNPYHPEWLLYSAFFVAFGIGSLFTLMGSMISDVCDYDELDTNERREGIFGAIYWWMVKIGMSLAMLLSGYMLDWSGFDVEVGEIQPDSTLLLLRVFDVGIPILTSAIAIAIMATYPITEQKAYEIREALEVRRGKLDGK